MSPKIEVILCDHCNKGFGLPNKKVMITLSEDDIIHSTRLGELHYHEECFYFIAGEEYKKKLNQKSL